MHVFKKVRKGTNVEIHNDFRNMFNFYDGLYRFMSKEPILMFVMVAPTWTKTTTTEIIRRVFKLEL